MILNSYLDRINFHYELIPDLPSLRLLHRQHLFTVPFENLDIHSMREIVLQKDKLLNKIIIEERGGFCYELNGVFYELLKAAGFKVIRISARVYENEGEPGPEFDHMALLVTINNEDYLADVGFGDSFIEPLRLVVNEAQKDVKDYFKILPGNDCCILYRSVDDKKYVPQYSFTITPRKLSDFNGICKYHQNSPQSHFTQKIICSMATETGRISLLRDRFIVTANGIKRQNYISDVEFYSILKSHFGISLKTGLIFPPVGSNQ